MLALFVINFGRFGDFFYKFLWLITNSPLINSLKWFGLKIHFAKILQQTWLCAVRDSAQCYTVQNQTPCSITLCRVRKLKSRAGLMCLGCVFCVWVTSFACTFFASLPTRMHSAETMRKDTKVLKKTQPRKTRSKRCGTDTKDAMWTKNFRVF